MGPLLVLLAAATGAAPAVVTVDAEPGVIAAARALGPGVAFFTARDRPLTSLSTLTDTAAQVGTGDVAGAKEVQALLRAGGVKVAGGAVDLMRLFGPNHFPSLFRRNSQLRLFVVRAREDGREQEITDRGGGLRLVFRRGDVTVGAISARPPTPPAGPFVTSFGPLVRADLSHTARHRSFDARAGVRRETRQAGKGNLFLVLHLARDFSTGAGLVSFLYGSGIIVKPEFEQLRVLDGQRRAYPLAAVHAEGTTVELAYEVPAGGRGFILVDGDTEHSLAPLTPARD